MYINKYHCSYVAYMRGGGSGDINCKQANTLINKIIFNQSQTFKIIQWVVMMMIGSNFKLCHQGSPLRR